MLGSLKKASYISVLSMIGSVMGLLRDLTIVKTLGAGVQADAYFIGIAVPSFIVYIFMTGSLSMALLPVLEQLRQSIWAAARYLFWYFVAIVSVLCILAIALSDHLLSFLAPGMEPDVQQLASVYFRMYCLGIPALAYASWIGALGNAQGRFTISAILNLLVNGCTVAFTLAWQGAFSGEGLVLGYLTGCFLYAAIAHIDARKLYQMQAPSYKGSVRHGLMLLKQWIPLLTAMILWEGTLIYLNRFANQAGSGGIAALGYANKLCNLPILLLALPFQIAVYPQLVKAGTRNQNFGRLYVRLGLITFTALMALEVTLLFLETFRSDILMVLFKDADAIGFLVKLTTYLSIGFALQGVVTLAQRILQAQGQQAITLRATIIASLISLALSIIISRWLDPLSTVGLSFIGGVWSNLMVTSRPILGGIKGISFSVLLGSIAVSLTLVPISLDLFDITKLNLLAGYYGMVIIILLSICRYSLSRKESTL